MIRASNHSSYPRVGENPLDQQLRAAWTAHELGKMTAADVIRVEDEVTTVAVAEQSRAFIDIVTDGMLRWEGPLSHLAHHLDGLELRELRRWFQTNFYDRRVAVVGEIARPRPFLVHDYKVAVSVAQKPVKTVLPGPVTFARLAHDEHYRQIGPLARAIAEALAAEVQDLAAEGATVFQLDEPLLCAHPGDLDLVAECAGRIFAAAGPQALTIFDTYFGDLTALAGRLDALPGTHLGLDLVCNPRGLALLEELPPNKNVYLGVFDATTTRLEDAEEVADMLEPYRDALTARDVLVGPQAGLELLPRNQAFDKLLQARYLVEKLTKEWTWAS